MYMKIYRSKAAFCHNTTPIRFCQISTNLILGKERLLLGLDFFLLHWPTICNLLWTLVDNWVKTQYVANVWWFIVSVAHGSAMLYKTPQ
jgi:hypothetical protein